MKLNQGDITNAQDIESIKWVFYQFFSLFLYSQEKNMHLHSGRGHIFLGL